MIKNFNIFSQDIDLISSELESALITSKIDNIDFKAKHPKGIYLIKFGKLESDNTIFYSYMYYNELFKLPLVAYFIYRSFANNLLNEEIKDCFVFIDNHICNSFEDFEYLEGVELNKDALLKGLYNMPPDVTLTYIFNYILKLNYKGSIDDMVSIIKTDI